MDAYNKVVVESDYRVNLEMKRDGEKLLSSWQISAFIENLSRSYYKNELLNTIESYINKGTDLENIFIIDESFKLNNIYKNLGILNLRNERDAKTLYHLGKPIGMLPNEKLIKINCVFEIFRKVNEILSEYKVKGLNKEKLSGLITFSISPNTTMIAIKEKIISLANENLNQSSQEEVRNNEQNKKIDQKKLANSIESSTVQVMSSYQKMESDFISLAITKESILANDIKDINETPSNITGYFNTFKSTFDNLIRPIIGIYNPNDNSVEIICRDFIDKTLYVEENKRFLDIKSISRNSPLAVCVVLGVGGLTFLSRHITVALDERLLQKQQAESAVNISEEHEIADLMSEIKQAIEERENNKEINITDATQDILDNLRRVNEERFVENAKDYGFLNEHAILKVRKEA
ncbi:hypothetical protein OCB08_27310 [Bacillus cereus]|nr:hypothetical protein [Bacillus cereus]AOM04167.1 hypothetical protein FORC24_0877 [Bacillus cereus]AOM08173.1 hypothetical protein FORC24_4883 [Bacillus cereus]MCC2370209.1 hypothetical protein [Bacillus cereus]MCC2450560.1 hypothetical protein [Bacillus cereus]MCC2491197.1 hypothetical protein [Bacillus cereus]